MKKIKNRIMCFVLALVSILTVMQPIPAFAEDYSTGGWDQLQVTTSVVNSSGGYVGTVMAGEGITILYISGDRAYIEYSAGNTYKRGFVSIYNLKYYGGFSDTAVGRVTSSSNTYYSPNTTYYAGVVNAGEYVAVLCNSNGWAYVEYNVSSGNRKRAFMPSSNLYCYSNSRASFYHVNTLGTRLAVPSRKTVYAGPNSSSYPVIGEIYTEDSNKVYKYWDFYDANGSRMWYVSYPAGNGEKYGYIYAY